jgi:hypothetical protein
MRTKLLRRRRLPPLPEPPPGHVLHFANFNGPVPIYIVNQLCELSLESGLAAHWHSDPSYFWAEQTKRKR